MAWSKLCLDLEDPALESLDDEMLARLPECLAALDPSAREAIELKYRRSGTLAHVAERLRRSESAARALLFRARQALRSGLESRPAPPVPE
jgi:DNA-directed RNA polymerase specialized sigma24 family protein